MVLMDCRLAQAGYTPDVARHMADVALVQHSPLDTRDGGAEETAYGVQCLDYLLRSPAGVLLRCALYHAMRTCALYHAMRTGPT